MEKTSKIPSSFDARRSRLLSMSGGEIRGRIRQEGSKGLDAARCALHAVPRVKLVRAAITPQFFFFADQLPQLAALLRDRFPDQVHEILARAERICAHRFDLLGYEDLNYGAEIDWHLDLVHGKRAPRKPWHKVRYLDFDEVGDVKVTWELNRHQHLVTLAKAFILTKDERFAKELFAQWYSWRDQNPYLVGVNWASSLEVAFRAISWMWIKHLLAGSRVEAATFSDDLRQALWLSGRHIERYLSTYFSPNTHLLGEGVGLFFLGVLCPELSSAARWQKLGWEIVLEEADRQVRSDGWHFEQSSYYHVYALDFFLHSALLAKRNDIQVPEHLEHTIENMLEALLLTSQAGVAPRFGDDDGGRLFDPARNRVEHMLDPLAAGAVLFGRADFKAAVRELREEAVWLLGAKGVTRFDELPETELRPRSTAFPKSGLYVMAGESSGEPLQVVIDAGPQGALSAGHGHADAISLQLAHAGRPLLIDPGTCEYVGRDNIRDLFRGTAAHNTLQIDGRDQSIPKGPFSWHTLITPTVNEWVTGENFDLLIAGYELNGFIHRRSVFYCKPNFWLVRDVVEGSGKHRITVSWHLAPGLRQDTQDSVLFSSSDQSVGICILPVSDRDFSVSLRNDAWSPVYGRKGPAPVFQIEQETALPAEIATVLAPTTDARNVGNFTRISDTERSAGEVTGYSYSVADEVHRMFFAPGGQTWAMQNWSSDAEFLYCREDASGLSALILCNGRKVALDETLIVSAEEVVNSCELMIADGRVISRQNDVITLHRWPEVKTSVAAGAVKTEPARSQN